MRTIFFAVPIFFLSFFPLAQADIFDVEAEQHIFNCIHSTEFCNLTIYYRFEDREYPIEILCNPKGEALWGCNAFLVPISSSLIMIADLPFDLVHHLEELFEELRSDEDAAYIDLKGFSSDMNLTSLHPVFIAERIDDPNLDLLVREVFNSTIFVNEVFYYYLNGKYYQVRILYNPEGRSFSATRRFRLGAGNALTAYTLSWDYKYGIIVDEPAPKKLIDHLSALVPASWWEWYFNFQIHNGSDVCYVTQTYGYNETITTTHYLDKWFDYTSDLK